MSLIRFVMKSYAPGGSRSSGSGFVFFEGPTKLIKPFQLLSIYV